MKKLILSQLKMADAYAVPVTSSIYQYFLELSNRKENMVGLILGEYQYFDDGSIDYEEHDLTEIVVSKEMMEAWKKFKKTSGQTSLLFSDYHFSLVSLRISESIVAENLAEAAAELLNNNEKYFGLKVTRMDYFEDGIVCEDSYLIFGQNKCSLKEAQELCQYIPQALSWVTAKDNDGIGSFLVDHASGEIAVPEKNTTFLPLRTFAVWGVSI